MRAALRVYALLLGAHLVSAAAVTNAQSDTTVHLIPLPREIRLAGARSLRGVSVAMPADSEDRFAARELQNGLRERGIRIAGTGTVHVTLLRAGSPAAARLIAREHLAFDTAMRSEGYVLVAKGSDAAIIGASGAGVFYGTQTLLQLVDGSGDGARLRGAVIRDWPAMRWRGLQDDLSRGPVPTLEFQKKQIRTLAAYKLNVYSPYFEQSLRYDAAPVSAAPGGAMTRDQVRELVAYARQYHIDVVPEQEAFGHLHHLLKYEQFSSLGETERGHVLAPDAPGSLGLIASWFAQIDSLFPSRFVHLGADETFELGHGRTAARVQQQGLGRVYLDFLTSIADTLRKQHARTGRPAQRYLFWGDIAGNSPDLVRSLPKDMVAVAWDYDPEPKGFDPLIVPFRAAGLETWVAPGVNNWNRVYPDFANALPNIQGFIRDGQRLGSTGVLNTTWDDDGEAIFNQVWYGVLFGAAASWQPGESDIARFQGDYGPVFYGDTTGAVNDAERALMSAHQLLRSTKAGDANDALFWNDPWTEEGALVAEKIRPVVHDLRMLAERAINDAVAVRSRPHREDDALAALELGARKIDAIGLKFELADDVVRMYARAQDTTSKTRWQDMDDILGMNGRLADLRDLYSLTRDEYEGAWSRENRPYWIHNVLAQYDVATQLWVSRRNRLNLARDTWSRTKRLPTPAEAGVPAMLPGLSMDGGVARVTP